MDIVREFFGFGGYRRAAEGYLSWEHLSFVTVLLALMTVLNLTALLALRREVREESRRA